VRLKPRCPQAGPGSSRAGRGSVRDSRLRRRWSSTGDSEGAAHAKFRQATTASSRSRTLAERKALLGEGRPWREAAAGSMRRRLRDRPRSHARLLPATRSGARAWGSMAGPSSGSTTTAWMLLFDTTVSRSPNEWPSQGPTVRWCTSPSRSARASSRPGRERVDEHGVELEAGPRLAACAAPARSTARDPAGNSVRLSRRDIWPR